MVALALSGLAFASTPNDSQAYEAARRAYYQLKAGGGKARGRDPWIKVAELFEGVARSYPKSDKAPLALYTAAELHNQLSRISLTAVDRQAAVADYQRVAQIYPRSNLADDALYQSARIAFDREDDPEAARASLDRILDQYGDGDMAKRAKAMLATLPPEAPKEAAKPLKAAPLVAAAPKVAKAAPKQKPAKALEVPVVDDDDSDDSQPATADEALSDKPAPPVAVAAAPIAEPPTSAPTVVGMTHDEGDDEAPEPAKPAATANAKIDAPSHKLFDTLRKMGPAPGGVSLAVQMGLKVHRVVIDAGHGGHDSGAIGPGGTKEKDVTLAIAKKLAEELKQQGLEVLLSRDDDSFVALEERASFANEAKADLFISIHCNAARDRKLRGTETYFLNVTDDRYALRLAARENQASEKSLSDLQLILADMATKADVEESSQLADSIQRSLTDGVKDPGRKDLGVKHALFYVLLGTRMPSVLVETEFLSNKDDEKQLKSDRTEAQLAKDIAQGVSRYVTARQGFAEAVP